MYVAGCQSNMLGYPELCHVGQHSFCTVWLQVCNGDVTHKPVMACDQRCSALTRLHGCDPDSSLVDLLSAPLLLSVAACCLLLAGLLLLQLWALAAPPWQVEQQMEWSECGTVSICAEEELG